MAIAAAVGNDRVGLNSRLGWPMGIMGTYSCEHLFGYLPGCNFQFTPPSRSI